MNSTPPTPDRRPPITPQMALRVAVFGAIALGLFAIVFFRLWYLQVLSGDEYLADANSNRVREVRIQAPRGEIADRNGRVIVENKQAVVVQLDPSELPEAERELAAKWGQDSGLRAAKPRGQRGDPVEIPAIPTAQLAARYRRLGGVLDMSATQIHRQVVRELAVVPYSEVRIKTDVPQSVLAYLVERPHRFPGVEVEQVYLRDYPRKELAAQILGTVGEVSPEELETELFRDVDQGTIVGKAGLERTYDEYLRGTDGIQRVQVDAFGRPIPSEALRRREPEAGQQLKLSIDLGMQQTGQRAFEGPANPGGNPGAYVAMDPRNGEVVAMGSFPSFDANVFTKPITEERLEADFGEEAGAPLFNRAVQGLYPVASTFKPITAVAGLESGVISAGEVFADTGCTMIGTLEQCNADGSANGPVNMTRALQVSSNVYFYQLGYSLYQQQGQVLQKWARRLGLGRETGIDLPAEFTGLVPDSKWREGINRKEVACREETGDDYCGFAFGEIRGYTGGDNSNLAVGQGDLQATPLQMAVAYSTIANGGKVVTPQLSRQIEDDQGRLVQRLEREPARRVDIADSTRNVVLEGLRLAAQSPGGTSAEVFAGWPHDRVPIYGKTGTAERPPNDNQSWYIAYAADEKRPLVVVTTVEEGGFGAAVAAPITRLLLSQYYEVQKRIVKGTSTDF